MKNILILLIACALCAGCKKNRTAVVKGKAINPITGVGNANYEVRILKATSGSIGTSGGYEEVAETFTDANGDFEIQYTGSGSLLLSCNLPVENYPIGWYQNGQKVNTSTTRMDIQKGEETYAEYHSVPYKEINLIVNHNSCEGSTDTTYFQTKRTIIDDSFSPLSTPQIGCLDSDSYADFLAGTWIYKFTLVRPSGTEIKYDTFYVDPDVTGQVINLNF